MASVKDHYLVMGISPVTKEADIRKVYKDLVKKYHPDLNPDNKEFAEKKMKLITKAHNVLTNRTSREEYDNSPHFKAMVPRVLKDSTPEHQKMLLREVQKKNPSFLDKLKAIFMKPNELEEAKKLTKNGVDRFTMGLTYMEKKEENILKMAKVEFMTVLKESPENPEALVNLGIIEYKLGNFEEAVRLLNKAFRHLPQSKQIKTLLDSLRDD